MEAVALPIELLPYEKLLGFAVHNVTPHQGIVLLQFQPTLIVATVLKGVVHVAALAAAELDQYTVSFFRHDFTFMIDLII